jgi:sulfite reductase (ferredoxin)
MATEGPCQRYRKSRSRSLASLGMRNKLSMSPKPESKVEIAKRNGRQLRGTIAETLASEATHFEHDDVQLLKFHGTYQQDSRDERRGREAAGVEKAYSFMVRVAIPAGAITAEQYLGLERIAEQHGNGTLRVTTRQGFQFHGVLKGDLKATIAGVHQELLTTISACGDVQRNVMGCAAPLADADHAAVREVAEALARELRPNSRAYHEIWLDGEKQVSTGNEEPFYGEVYLPRKFKVAVGLSIDNCVDVWSQDVGLLAIVTDGKIQGFNLLVGGGLGMTHNKGDTTARLAQPLGFVPTAHGVEAVRLVASIFRDHGNRSDRRHARLKYLIAEWGIDKFREEFQRRAAFRLAPAVPLDSLPFHDHLGPHRQPDGRSFYGVFIQSGRIEDTPRNRVKTALHEIITRLRPGIRLTGQQNLLLTDLEQHSVRQVELLLRRHGVTPPQELSAARRFSMACPALPTCGLAVAESERAIPDLLDQFEAELEGLGLREAPLTIRMTGCPNGCARPYTADLAFVGRSLGLYNVYVGGGLASDRLVDLYRADVPIDDLLLVTRPLLARWSTERREGEGLGDFYQRIVGRSTPRAALTGKEQPTFDLVQLEMSR